MDFRYVLEKLGRVDAWNGTTGQIDCDKIVADNTVDGKEFPSIDGLCNNLAHPFWGATKAPFARMTGTHYGGDGMNDPTTERLGRPLPNARNVSVSYDFGRTIFDHQHSFLIAEFGHFVAHDVSKKSGGSNVNCKKDRANPICFDIPVPPNDHQFGAGQPNEAFRTPYLELKRSGTVKLVKGAKQARQQFNDNTGLVDASAVYGSNVDTAMSLRRLSDADLLAFHDRAGKEFLPFDAGFSGKLSAKCQGQLPLCYHAGDSRATQSTTLAMVHGLWLRLHNRIVVELKGLNSHWSEERVYREARQIVAALLQRVVYEEYVPALLGKRVVDAMLPSYGGYNESVDPTIFIEFVSAAFRMGHSQMVSRIDLLDPDYTPIGELLLRDDFKQAGRYYLEPKASFDNYMRGLLGKKAYEVDRFTTKELNDYLFQPVDATGRPNGPADDLTAVTIQRGRDHGLPSWLVMKNIAVDYFKTANVRVPNPIMEDGRERRLLAIYGDMGRIDLYVGGVSETHMPKSELGPTFSYIVAKQFLHSRDGDRFFYKNPGVFMPSQERAIDATTLAAIICYVADNPDTMKVQANAFDFAKNDQRQYCSDLLTTNGLDLKPWKGGLEARRRG